MVEPLPDRCLPRWRTCEERSRSGGARRSEVVSELSVGGWRAPDQAGQGRREAAIAALWRRPRTQHPRRSAAARRARGVLREPLIVATVNSLSDPFRDAVLRRDPPGMVDALAPGVVFNSPVAFKPFEGREAVGQVLAAVMGTFEDFSYTGELAGETGHALIFEARVGDKQVQGIDLLRFDADGKIDDFTV